MSSGSPYKRPTLGRSTAVRHMAAAYRHADTPARRKPRTGGPLKSTEDVVLEAVKLGYKIADEQIVKGQDFARRLRGASLRSDSGELGSLVDQALRLAKQFAILLVEATETTAQAPAIVRRVAKANAESLAEDAGVNGTPAPVAREGSVEASHSGVPVLVQAKAATRVSLVFHKKVTEKPMVFPLYAVNDEATPPLRGITFQGEPSSSDFTLHVTIPDHQPRGEYRGYAINPADRQPVGTIVVDIKG